jgi:hypothetical protein
MKLAQQAVDHAMFITRLSCAASQADDWKKLPPHSEIHAAPKAGSSTLNVLASAAARGIHRIHREGLPPEG